MCLNAWNDGPFVNVETSDNPVIQNNHFQVLGPQPDGNYVLQFVGGGTWNHKCVGDAYNKSGKADTSLDPCGNNGSGAGWGTQLQEQSWPNGGGPCYPNQVAFFDWHWHGYLGPTSPMAANGSPWYLNKPKASPICFNIIT